MLTARMKSRSILSLLYPPACLLCRDRLHTEEAAMCDACQQAMTPCLPPVCQRCGLPMNGAYDARPTCAHCQRTPPAFEQARAAFLFAGQAREAIHAFKYDGRRRLGRWLAARMAQTAGCEFPCRTIEAVMPVPLHWAKIRLRGMNPAGVLAREVAARLAVPCESRTLRRVRWTATQTRLSRRQRLRNVTEAFQADPSRPVVRSVLVVDDVLTSGATAHACATALRQAGVARVWVVAAARAVLE